MRRAASRLSMVLGGVLFVAGLAMRAGVLGTVHGAVGPSGVAPTGSFVALATLPTTMMPTLEPTIEPTPTPEPTQEPTAPPTPEPTAPPTDTPSASGELLFADDFDTEAAWPVGKVTGGKAQYDAGWYVVSLSPIDLPGYIYPAADGPLPAALVVETTLRLAGPDAMAGPFVVDAAGTKIGVILSSTGRVTISRDSVEAFDVLGSGSTRPTTGPVRLTLVVGPDGTTAFVDGQVVATAREHLTPAAFGLIVWSQTATGAVRFDHFEVRATGA